VSLKCISKNRLIESQKQSIENSTQNCEQQKFNPMRHGSN